MSQEQKMIAGFALLLFLAIVLFAVVENDYRELRDLQRRVGTIEANRK